MFEFFNRNIIIILLKPFLYYNISYINFARLNKYVISDASNIKKICMQMKSKKLRKTKLKNHKYIYFKNIFKI